MSIVPIHGTSQSSIAGTLDETALAAMEGLCTALSISESSVLTERQVAAAKCEDVMANMMRKFRELSEMNRRLQEQMILSERSHREREIVHVSETLTAQQEIERLHEEVNAMRQAMVASTRTSEEQVATLIAQQADATRLATEANDARVALLQQEIEDTKRDRDQRLTEAHAERNTDLRILETQIAALQHELAASKNETKEVTHRVEELLIQRKVAEEIIQNLSSKNAVFEKKAADEERIHRLRMERHSLR